MRTALAALLALTALGACRSTRGADTLPFVQPSSDGTPVRTVSITKSGNFSPPCVVINLGDTVEWYNPTTRAINVTSAAKPGASPELYSPSLVASATRWRHTFNSPGRINYLDQGGSAASSYYASAAPAATASAAGTICVRNDDGSGCTQLCCLKGGPADQCGGGACEVNSSDREISYGFCAAPTTAAFDASVSD